MQLLNHMAGCWNIDKFLVLLVFKMNPLKCIQEHNKNLNGNMIIKWKVEMEMELH